MKSSMLKHTHRLAQFESLSHIQMLLISTASTRFGAETSSKLHLHPTVLQQKRRKMENPKETEGHKAACKVGRCHKALRTFQWSLAQLCTGIANSHCYQQHGSIKRTKLTRGEGRQREINVGTLQARLAAK